MKKIYTKPEVEVIVSDDVILISYDDKYDNKGNDKSNWSRITL